ncbi:hypothetical protein F5Y06DRAFT_272721 [Hypoxylon sp. FL0890]|nr:hypothetical protein F5Y06DRAFT_272721 [Hypoxylon sp. FL0890]
MRYEILLSSHPPSLLRGILLLCFSAESCPFFGPHTRYVILIQLESRLRYIPIPIMSQSVLYWLCAEETRYRCNLHDSLEDDHCILALDEPPPRAFGDTNTLTRPISNIVARMVPIFIRECHLFGSTSGGFATYLSLARIVY